MVRRRVFVARWAFRFLVIRFPPFFFDTLLDFFPIKSLLDLTPLIAFLIVKFALSSPKNSPPFYAIFD
jgi:hypothetical protein